MDEQIRQYLSMKLATEIFRSNPEFLTGVQQQELQQRVDKLYQLQNSILSSSEAQLIKIAQHEIDQVYQSCVEQCESLTQFHQLMRAQKMTVEGLRWALNRELRCEKVLELVSEAAPELQREQALEYYQKHQIDFSRGRTWNLSQILITINPDYEENRRENAWKRITEVREQASASNFSELALQHSECPSALEDGRLGWCEEDKLYPEIVNSLYSLQLHQVSEPVETEVGFHLVVYHDEKPPYTASFEEVWPFLQQKHLARARSYMQRQWMAQLSN